MAEGIMSWHLCGYSWLQNKNNISHEKIKSVTKIFALIKNDDSCFTFVNVLHCIKNTFLSIQCKVTFFFSFFFFGLSLLRLLGVFQETKENWFFHLFISYFSFQQHIQTTNWNGLFHQNIKFKHSDKLLKISYSCLSVPETVYVKMSLKEGKITARGKKKKKEDRNDILAMKNATKKKYIFAWHK